MTKEIELAAEAEYPVHPAPSEYHYPNCAVRDLRVKSFIAGAQWMATRDRWVSVDEYTNRKTMKKYKIVKYDDRYYMTYKAVLYKQIKIWSFSFWIEWEITKGKDWWVMSVINEWQNKFDVKGFEDRTEI